MSLVFLSYARSDMPVAQRIASALIASGYEVWWDEQLPAHRTFYDVIEERLRSAHAVVVLWSRDALQSQWVRAEADLARTLDTLVQATVDGAMPPLPFNQVQCAQLADWTGQPEHREWRRVLESVGALAKGNTAPRAPASPRTARRRVFTSRDRAFAAIAAVALLGVAALAYLARDHLDRTAQTTTPASLTFVATSSGTRYQRLTQAVGIEERPAASPDGKMVAYAATVNGRSTIWVQMIAGGAPLQIAAGTHPRWLPDSSALVYLVAAESGDAGELWEVAALGGAPRRLTIASGGADVSHDGTRLAVVRNRSEENDLVVFARDGAAAELTHTLPTASSYSTPRWSPDDRTIALIANEGGFSNVIYLVDVDHGKASTIAHASFIEGQSWLPDGSGLVYASSTGSAPVYPPSFHLRRVDASGAHDRPLTIGDVSYVNPDIAKSGALVASQVSMRSDIWNFPFGDLPAENTAHGVRMTRQTGQVRTPSMSPDARHVAYLSDTGGHANVWVSQVDGTAMRQVTFERDPDVVIGLPLWSPSGDRIVFVRRDEQGSGEWLVSPDGGAPQRIVPSGVNAQWSMDGRWLYYYTPPNKPSACIERVPVAGGPSERVRCGANAFAVSSDGQTVYFATQGVSQNRILRASPPDAAPVPFAEYAADRIPTWPTGFVVSPDDGWLALPLKDGATTDIWVISTEDGRFRKVTDFRRPTLIGRQVAWSPDGKSIVAAVAEVDADVVLLEGLVH